MLGLFNAAHWSPDLDNAESKRFVAAFEKEYGRIPSAYAAQGYDAALMIDGAVRAMKGKVEDRDALSKRAQDRQVPLGARRFKMSNNTSRSRPTTCAWSARMPGPGDEQDAGHDLHATMETRTRRSAS